MHPLAIIEVLLLVAAANGAPILAKRILGAWASQAIDGGRLAPDGRPWLGPSKTIRGLVVALLAALMTALAIGAGWRLGLLIGAAAMAGDLLSSFTKRRLGLKSSSMALGIDQVPESLLPALVAAGPLGLSMADVVAILGLFFVGELVLSRIFFWIGIRDQPY